METLYAILISTIIIILLVILSFLYSINTFVCPVPEPENCQQCNN